MKTTSLVATAAAAVPGPASAPKAVAVPVVAVAAPSPASAAEAAEASVDEPAEDVKQPHTASDEDAKLIYDSDVTFEDLKLKEDLLKGVYAMGFTKPSKIQARAIPVLLAPEHPSIVAQAHHGSGKTAAYLLAILQCIDHSLDHPQAVCVCPTRELADQVFKVSQELTKFTPIKTFLAVFGCENRPVTEQLVVGTPGTICGLGRKIVSGQTLLNLKKVTMVCIDEADEVLKQSQKGDSMTDQALKIKQLCARGHQALLFSATFPENLERFIDQFAPQAARIVVKREHIPLDNVSQFFMDCENTEERYAVLKNIYCLLSLGQSIIFAENVAEAKLLAQRMRADSFQVALLHGKLTPEERDKTMNDFRTGKATVLIATNVLSRGIDVVQVSLVINYDLPSVFRARETTPDVETYMHRVGRAGRFGRKGVAITLVHDTASRKRMEAVRKHYNMKVSQLPKDDLEQIEANIKTALDLD